MLAPRFADIHMLGPPLAERHMFAYVHKNRAALAPTLADALWKMKRDGTCQRTFEAALKPPQTTSPGATP